MHPPLQTGRYKSRIKASPYQEAPRPLLPDNIVILRHQYRLGIPDSRETIFKIKLGKFYPFAMLTKY